MFRNFLICSWLFSALSWAQSYTGSVRGTITDNTTAGIHTRVRVQAVESPRRGLVRPVIDSRVGRNRAGGDRLRFVPPVQRCVEQSTR